MYFIGTTDSKKVGQESLTLKSLISNWSLYCQFHSRWFWIIGLLKGTQNLSIILPLHIAIVNCFRYHKIRGIYQFMILELMEDWGMCHSQSLFKQRSVSDPFIPGSSLWKGPGGLHLPSNFRRDKLYYHTTQILKFRLNLDINLCF